MNRLSIKFRSPLLLKITFAIFVLILSSSVPMAGTQSRDSGFARFKRQMMPKVGKKVTVVGRLASAKLGWLVTFKNGSVYIYAVKDSDNPKMSDLNRYDGQTVEATGTLGYNEGSPSARPDEAAVPEHFFLDVAEAKVTVLSPSRQSRRK